jgi:hypothetical protein
MQAQGLSGRDLIAFGAGLLMTGLGMGRIAPPVAGQAIRSLSAMAGRDPFDTLAQDHRNVLAMFNVIERTDSSARARRAALLFQIKRMLTAHALAEEDIVYPMLRDDAASRGNGQPALSRAWRDEGAPVRAGAPS